MGAKAELVAQDGIKTIDYEKYPLGVSPTPRPESKYINHSIRQMCTLPLGYYTRPNVLNRYKLT